MRAAELPPFVFCIAGDGIALPEIVGGYSFDEPKAGRPATGKFDAYSSITEAHTAGHSASSLPVGQVRLLTSPRAVGENQVSSIVRFLKNKRVIRQEELGKTDPTTSIPISSGDVRLAEKIGPFLSPEMGEKTDLGSIMSQIFSRKPGRTARSGSKL